MAIHLRFTTQFFQERLTARLDFGPAQRLRPRSDRPTLVMHWVEEPGGRVCCHWVVERP